MTTCERAHAVDTRVTAASDGSARVSRPANSATTTNVTHTRRRAPTPHPPSRTAPTSSAALDRHDERDRSVAHASDRHDSCQGLEGAKEDGRAERLRWALTATSTQS